MRIETLLEEFHGDIEAALAIMQRPKRFPMKLSEIPSNQRKIKV